MPSLAKHLVETRTDPVLQVISLLFKPFLLHSGQNFSVIFTISSDQTRESMRRKGFSSHNQVETFAFKMKMQGLFIPGKKTT